MLANAMPAVVLATAVLVILANAVLKGKTAVQSKE